MVVDDCWQKERPSGFIGGDWRESNVKFPDRAALAAEIQSLDVLPGIRIRPLQNKAEALLSPALYRDREQYIIDPALDETLALRAEEKNTTGTTEDHATDDGGNTV